MTSLKIKIKLIIVIFHCMILNLSIAQNLGNEKMVKLSFLGGEWIGISKTYENGKLIKEIPVFERINYDLDSSILVLQLNSEALLLHTIIYFDETDNTYYYYPFSKHGVRPAPAVFKNGQLVVQSSEIKRFIFAKTEQGFREYGEVFENGRWIKYFQDDFINTN